MNARSVICFHDGNKVKKIEMSTWDEEINLSRIKLSVDRPTVEEFKAALEADPVTAQKLYSYLENQKPSESPSDSAYKRNRIGFCA